MIALLTLFFAMTGNDPLTDRQFRTALFEKLVSEIKGLELPPNSGNSSALIGGQSLAALASCYFKGRERDS